MPQHYRVIVIGCGAIGAAAAYWLSRRLGGDAVPAIDGTSQFPVSAFRADRPAITGAGQAPVRATSM